jgi:mevalonate kinase
MAADPALGKKLDQQMTQSVELCERALALDEAEGLKVLKQGMDLALDSFEQWGLTRGSVQDHLQMLRTAGAYAVKPTGSGDGGYILSLWENQPPMGLSPILNSCF